MRDVRHIKSTKGKDSLDKSTESEYLSEFEEKPGAKTLINNGIKISAIRMKTQRETNKIEKIFEKNLSDSFLPDLVFTPDTTGIKAEFIAPSPKILLNRFGNLKATKKQSDIIPAPITLAINKSLI